MKRIITKETREKMRLSMLKNYKTGKRKAVFKGEKRPDHSKVMKAIYSDWMKPMYGEDNPEWKGDMVGYHGLHKWVYKNKERTKNCGNCGEKDVKTHFANISHEYKRDVEDFIELCVKCHRRYDLGKISLFYG